MHPGLGMQETKSGYTRRKKKEKADLTDLADLTGLYN